MLRLLVHRARAQWPLLAALLAVAMVGPTLLGACALLVTRTAEQALEAAASRAAPARVDVTAYTVTVRGPDARSVADDTRRVLTSALAPFAATTAARASSMMRSLPATRAGGDGVPAETYLSGVEDLPTRAALVTGRWPRGAAAGVHPGVPQRSDAVRPAAPLEAVVLEPTARLLGLTLGRRVHLGAELGGDPSRPVDVTVVGVVRPLPGTGWDRDPLAATGYDLAYHDGRSVRPVHAYGPFIVDLATLLAGGSTIDRLEITAHPDLSTPTRRGLDTVAEAVLSADRQLARTLGDRVRIERVASRLPSTLLSARDQQQVTAAAVLTVAVLGIVLTATALALAGRLTAGVRADETALLSALGVSRGQFAAAAVVEAGALAVLAAALAIPASSVLHAGLTHLPPLAEAGLAVHPVVTGVHVLAVAGGALALAAVLVALSVRPTPVADDRRHRRELLARSGADVLLVAFAVIGWWQLRDQPTGSGSSVDAIRMLAPALLLTAGAALALRLVVPALRGVERLARRARGLTLPLAAFEAARRPQAVAAGLLIGLACAAATFGVGFDATWQRSQHDQADLAVGTDLALTLGAPPEAGQGAAVGAATGGTVSPATDRGVAVGQWLGNAGDVPRLIAVDTTRAESLLRGRLNDGRRWTDVGAALAPPTRATGVPVPKGAVLTLTGKATGTGKATDTTPLIVTPRLLLQDATGLRIPCDGAPVRLDGKAHPLPACATVEGLRLVAVSLPFAPDLGNVGFGFSDAWAELPAGAGDSRVAVTLTVPETPAPAPVSAPAPAPESASAPASGSASVGAVPGSPWSVTSVEPAPGQLGNPAVALARTPAGVQLKMTTTVGLKGPPDAARTLVATAFPAAGPVPVAVSSRFADEVSARRGSRLNLTVGLTPVSVRVSEVLPTVPSAPGAAAILADSDALSRALVIGGNLDLPVDAWWVGDPTRADAAVRAAALRLGAVTTRASETARLTGGPLRAGLPAALRLLVPATALLLLAGVVLHVTFDLRSRALEVARLRGLGMTRREVRAVLLGQHVGVLLPLLATGAAVGALATRVVAPLLVRSDTGAAPVPVALPIWPWAAEAGLLALLLAGCTLAVTAVVVVQARRVDVAYLRVAS
ncbi:FtsX-like permease family protein [Nonomuraea aurantiaca]|uniref:FtsX-like permease family protein n=1 Tax=Nonomuraea aurantiaca TaxID=2878562 RepID=UPI001CD92C9A|nr:FtsX-like permease family protein [Nonomuraea aurantiaca]MCA2227028.1 permease [Nonomuraea aurantiaca]